MLSSNESRDQVWIEIFIFIAPIPIIVWAVRAANVVVPTFTPVTASIDSRWYDGWTLKCRDGDCIVVRYGRHDDSLVVGDGRHDDSLVVG